MKANFSEGFVPLKASLQEEVRRFSGRTGTNMPRTRKKLAMIKRAQDDVGMAGQIRVSAPKPPKAVEQKEARITKPSLKGVNPPKVPFPTVTGVDQV